MAEFDLGVEEVQASEATGGGSRESAAISSLSTQLSEQQGRVAGQQNTTGALTQLNADIAQTQVTQAVGQAVSTTAFSLGAQKGFDNLFD